MGLKRLIVSTSRAGLLGLWGGMGATGGLAQTCPGPDDMATGVRLTFSNGNYETYRHLDTGMTEVDLYSGATGGRLRIELAAGLFLVAQSEIIDDLDDPILQRSVAYAEGYDALVVPTNPGVSTKLRTSVSEPDYGVNSAGVTLTTAAHPDVVVGGCAYGALGVELRYGAAENWPEELETLVYLPRLGFGYLARFQSGDGPAEDYLLVDIATVK